MSNEAHLYLMRSVHEMITNHFYYFDQIGSISETKSRTQKHPTTCKCCGAIMKSNVCEYCGAEYFMEE